MEVSYATMEAMGMLIQRLSQDARRLEKALAETMHTSAEWKRIADELKAERNAEREQHTAIKQALGIQAAKEAGKVLGMVEGEGMRGAAERMIKERDALRTECDDLRRVFSLVHGSLGIQQGEHIGNAIDALKKERDELATRLRQSIARGDERHRQTQRCRSLLRLATLAAELETERERHRQTAAVPQSVDVPRTHPVPCDPPEATHITPDGKATAQAAVTPQPGDVVRLEEDK